MGSVSLLCFLASYTLAFGVELARSRWENAAIRWGGWLAIAAGAIAHTVYLWNRAQSADVAPFTASPHDWLLVLAWLLVVTLLVVSRLLPKIAIGSYLLPPAIAIVAVASFVDAETPLRENSWWVSAHSAILVVGLGGLVLAFVSSLMYLSQHRRLKSRQLPTRGARLLDLETLSRWNWWCVVVAVPLITVGFAMGATLSIASERSAEAVPLLSLPIVVMAVLWLGMVGLMLWLLTRPRAGGTAVAIRTAWACGFVVVIMLSLTLLQPRGGLHGRPNAVDAAPADAASSSEAATDDSLAAQASIVRDAGGEGQQ